MADTIKIDYTALQSAATTLTNIQKNVNDCIITLLQSFSSFTDGYTGNSLVGFGSTEELALDRLSRLSSLYGILADYVGNAAAQMAATESALASGIQTK